MATNHYCFLCLYYNGYYVKGNYSFLKKSHGECTKKHCTVNNNDGCDNWKPKSEVRKEASTLKLNKLEKLSDNLSELILILKENFEEFDT